MAKRACRARTPNTQRGIGTALMAGVGAGPVAGPAKPSGETRMGLKRGIVVY